MDLIESFTEMNIEYIELYEEADSKPVENNIDPFGICKIFFRTRFLGPIITFLILSYRNTRSTFR
jgi:hypothetical protein